MYAPVLITPPEGTPITLAEAKANCRVDADNTDEDGLITGLIDSATSLLDGYSGTLGRCLMTQTWRVSADSLSSCMRLPFPAASVVVNVTDEAGTPSTVASSNYTLLHDARGSYVQFKDAYSYPTDLAETAAVTIDVTAGYGDAEDVPAAIRQAMHLLVAHWFSNREAVNVGNITSALPFAVDALITPFRRIGV